MKEATVLSSFMTAVRKALPEAVVVKHRDASMIGLPDCSVTHNGHVVWLEAKLFDWKPWMQGLDYYQMGTRLLAECRKTAETQHQTMLRLHRASGSLYIIWIKKTVVLFVDPVRLTVTSCPTTSIAADWLVWLLQKWPKSDFPSML